MEDRDEIHPSLPELSWLTKGHLDQVEYKIHHLIHDSRSHIDRMIHQLNKDKLLPQMFSPETHTIMGLGSIAQPHL
jgi:hypothetical protein